MLRAGALNKGIILFLTLLLSVELLLSNAVHAITEGEPPVTSIQIDGVSGANGYYYGNVSVLLTASDSSGIASTQYKLYAEDTWKTYTQPFNLAEGKAYEIHYRSTDTNGNVEATKTRKITVKSDSHPPISEIAITGAVSPSGFYNSSVSVEITASDFHSGVERSEYSLDNGLTWTIYEMPVEIEDEGQTIIRYRSVDNSGNIEKQREAKINIDLTAPAVPLIVADPAEWTNGSVSIELSDGDDQGSGAARSQYRLDENAQWIDYSVPFVVDAPGTIVQARTMDFAGNWSEVAFAPVRIDRNAPTPPWLTINPPDWSKDPVAVIIEPGTDDESMVQRVEYRIGDATEWMEYVTSFTVEVEGIIPVHARTVDRAGNVSTEAEDVVKVDKTPPNSPGPVSLIQKTGTSALISWMPTTDALSGVAEYEIYNGEQLLAVTEQTRIRLTDLELNARHTITVRATDVAGNQSEPSPELIFFTSDPSISAGRFFGFAWNAEGITWGWGENGDGTLADGTRSDRHSATVIPALADFIMIDASAVNSIGLKSDGTVWVWGLEPGGVREPHQITGLNDIVAVSAGIGHYLALKEDGTVWSWGENGFGELGNGTTVSNQTPAQVAGLADVIGISAAYYHSVALRKDGTVWSWGHNSQGQLGYVTDGDQLIPARITNLEGITQIDAASSHNVALKWDGTVWTWGWNGDGQLGDGTTTNRSVPVQIDSLTGIIKISASYTHNLALTSEGKVWAWGFNSGALGDGTVMRRVIPVAASHLNGMMDIAAGEYASMAVKQDGSVWAWGDNQHGQLGDGTTANATTRVLVQGIPYSADTTVPEAPLQLIVAGKTSSSVVLRWLEASDNHGIKEYLVYRGETLVGTVAVDGNTIDESTSFTVTGLSEKTEYSFTVKAKDYAGLLSTTSESVTVTTDSALPYQVSGGNNHTLMLKSDGSVWSWGSNSYGQLGTGLGGDKRTPVQAVGLDSIISISAGSTHSLALKSDGTVWAWGDNSSGQLGVTTPSRQYAPVKVEGLSSIVAIAAGHTHSLALGSDGRVWAWGQNFFGELGMGNTTASYVPKLIPSLTGVTSISAGHFFSLATKSDGTLWSWGYNEYGKLGDGTTINRNAPIRITSLSNIASASAGAYHAIALKTDGTVWGWGMNTFRQLGDGTTTNRSTPVNVAGLTGVTQISAGFYHNLALKSDQTVSAWGYNVYGQLGNGSTSTATAPVTVSSLSGVTHVEAGFYHSASVAGSSVKTWGFNQSGQLGNGTTMSSSLPITINFGTQAQRIGVQAPVGHVEETRTIEEILKDHPELSGIDTVQPVDWMPPSAPQNVAVSVERGGVNVNWVASEDNTGVTEYLIYVNNNLLTRTEEARGVIVPDAGDGWLTVTVQAVDAAGNHSIQSVPITVYAN